MSCHVVYGKDLKKNYTFILKMVANGLSLNKQNTYENYYWSMMSLFDFIQYSGTDLNSKEELSKLPPNLFKEYRTAAFAYYGRITEMELDYGRITEMELDNSFVEEDLKISGMAVWQDDGGGSKGKRFK